MSSSFGHSLRVTTFGESHGAAVGVIVDGCPPGLTLDLEAVQAELDRRRPGQGPLSSPRQEADQVELLSGVYDGRTLGTPITLVVRNRDARPEAYDHLKGLFRPSHADYTYAAKYGHRDHRGGGRASARETVGRVAAGAIARQLLEGQGVEVLAWVSQIAEIEAPRPSAAVTRAQIEAGPTRCPDPAAAAQMLEAVEAAKRDRDTLGGVISAEARGVPPGWGAPVFDKLSADLAKALMSLPAARGFELGEGFGAAAMRGSEHNDAFTTVDGQIRTRTNHSGGVQGGISNGEVIRCRVAFKPVATLFQPQDTVRSDGSPLTFTAKGRHDPCVLPRAAPIVEAMICLTLADHWLRHRALTGRDAAAPAS